MENVSRKTNSSNEIQAISPKSDGMDIVNKIRSGSSLSEYGRREDMVKTCLLEMDVAEKLSGYFVKTPLFGFRTQPAIFAAIMIGFDEGKRPTVALRDYCEIKGATLAKYGAAFLRDFVRFGGSFKIVERSEKRAAIEFTFDGTTTLFEWTIEEARRAGLLTKDNWNNYPADMLYWRCVARGVRSICPQATGGFYLPEEKGVFVDRDGVPVEDSLNATRPMRSVAPPQNFNQTSSNAQAKLRMYPEQVREWCSKKAKIISDAMKVADTKDILLSVVNDHLKHLDAIKRGCPDIHKSLQRLFSEMQSAIEMKATELDQEQIAIEEDDPDQYDPDTFLDIAANAVDELQIDQGN